MYTCIHATCYTYLIIATQNMFDNNAIIATSVITEC